MSEALLRVGSIIGQAKSDGTVVLDRHFQLILLNLLGAQQQDATGGTSGLMNDMPVSVFFESQEHFAPVSVELGQVVDASPVSVGIDAPTCAPVPVFDGPVHICEVV